MLGKTYRTNSRPLGTKEPLDADHGSAVPEGTEEQYDHCNPALKRWAIFKESTMQKLTSVQTIRAGRHVRPSKRLPKLQREHGHPEADFRPLGVG